MYAGLPKNLKTWKNLEFVKTLKKLRVSNNFKC